MARSTMVYIISLLRLKVNDVKSTAAKLILSRGDTDTKAASSEFYYELDGITYYKAAAETAFTASTHDIAIDKWSSYLLSIALNGTITITKAASDYATEALAIAAVPSTPTDNVRMGYLTIKTADGVKWDATTDALKGGSSGSPASETNYYPDAETTSTWSDDELQDYLDMHRQYISREELGCDPDDQTYQSSYTLLEGDASTWSGTGDPTDAINIWDSADEDGTAYTPDDFNLKSGTFIFDEEQDELTYYLDAYTYDLEAAIAECLEQLAMDQNKAQQWSRGSVSWKPYDLMKMAEYHRGYSGASKARLI